MDEAGSGSDAVGSNPKAPTTVNPNAPALVGGQVGRGTRSIGAGPTAPTTTPAPVSGPTTGSAPAAGPVTKHGNTPADFRRRTTSKQLLQIEWSYPVWTPHASGGSTEVGSYQLPLDEALALLADKDPRPLLILRECERCKGTDHALLFRDLDNEQTALLSRWFHCVKLAPNVLEDRNPFGALFRAVSDHGYIPHLLVCGHDGSNKKALSGEQTQAELWGAMFAQLEREYEGDAPSAVKELRTMLTRFDKLDDRELELKRRLAAESDKNGSDSTKSKQYAAEIAGVQGERDKLLKREQQLRTMVRKSPATARAEPARPADK